ncbi:hypothetical protein C5167_031272 [Papaver somniferum]|nr:hypothetical protein C5167_031272 [Papaver somniferum]
MEVQTHTGLLLLWPLVRNLREGVSSMSCSSTEPSSLYHQVLKYDSEAFEYSIPGALNHQSGENRADGAQASVSTRRQKVKKKGNDDVSLTQPDHTEVQDGIIRGYTERLEELCSRAETLSEDQDEADVQLLSSTDLKSLVNGTMTIRGKKILHFVPLDILVRLLSVLDLLIRAAEGVSLDENEDVIERVVDFSRHQIMESMRAWDPSYRALHKPNENGPYDGGEDEEEDVEFGSPNKKRRGSRSVKGRRPTGKWKQVGLPLVTAAVNAVL